MSQQKHIDRITMNIIGIDPGNTHTAIVMISGYKILEHHYLENEAALLKITESASCMGGAEVYCEMIASYGMPVGKTIFDTCVFIGRILQSIPHVKLITRNVVKNEICHSSKAKDANIRQSLIDVYGAPGTKKTPGGTFGISGDKWAALAVATAAQRCAKLYELRQNES